MTEIAVGSVDLLRDVITKDRDLPKGYDGWLIRTIRPDFRSSNDYRYPFPGKVAKAPGPITEHGSPCPRFVGDGICAATTWEAMASGDIPALALLLVAYREKDVLASLGGKLRLRKFRVVEVIDGARLLVTSGHCADLRGANLSGADLRGANLDGANLGGANLGGANLDVADLDGANLRGANLRGANLGGASLDGANLHGANLDGASLDGADLRDADLRGADLRGADLDGADLRGADLGGANLDVADLRGADLGGANLRGANLDGADLRDADLRGADLDRSRWGIQPSGHVRPK